MPGVCFGTETEYYVNYYVFVHVFEDNFVNRGVYKWVRNKTETVIRVGFFSPLHLDWKRERYQQKRIKLYKRRKA